jgi:NADH-quinone oxidoreductase subunit L
MPVTAVCAFVAAASISGIPPFNGYFSKEFIYHGAKETGLWVFVIAAMLGSTLTLMSFLKLTFATYLGARKPESAGAQEAHWTMVAPMVVIAAGCVLFGVYNQLPLRLFIQPLISAPGVPFAGVELTHHAWQITPVTGLAMAFLVLALVAFFLGRARTRQSLSAVDYIHGAPVLRSLYNWSEKRYFDVYDLGRRIHPHLAGAVHVLTDRVADWLVENLARAGLAIGERLRRAHTGLLAVYLSWLVFGLVILMLVVGGVFR